MRSRLGNRRLLLALGALAAALVVAVPLAWASHQFTDVPDGHPFHGDISAVRGAGITSGKTCDPPGTPQTYCPTEAITREAMAAFVHRGFGRAGLSDTLEVPIGDTLVDLGAVTIDVGGVAGNTQFVKLDAAVTTYIDDPTGCPCETFFFIWSDSLVSPVSTTHYLLNDVVAPSTGFGDETGAVTAVVPVGSGTTQTFRVLAARDGTVPSTGVVTGFASMTAMTAPFGSTGASTLNTPNLSGRAAPPKGVAYP